MYQPLIVDENQKDHFQMPIFDKIQTLFPKGNLAQAIVIGVVIVDLAPFLSNVNKRKTKRIGTQIKRR